MECGIIWAGSSMFAFKNLLTYLSKGLTDQHLLAEIKPFNNCNESIF